MTTRVGSETPPRTALGHPEIRKLLVDFVKRRVPPADVDDVVQTILCDALAAASVPGDRDELRKWLIGIARHKVADLHRKAKREAPVEAPEQEAPPAPLEAREMVRWAEEQLDGVPAASRRSEAGGNDARQTLEWMAREGEGEKLESIAADEEVPAARVRQRVSRLRRWMKQRWLAELAAVAALALLAFIAYRLLRGAPPPEARPDRPPPSPEAPAPDPNAPEERARVLRAEARERCERRDWKLCLDRLDQARDLDAAGDRDPAIQALRSQAEDGQRRDTLEQKKEIDSKQGPRKSIDEEELDARPRAPAPTAPRTSTPPPAPKAPPVTKPKAPSPKESKSSFEEAIQLESSASTGGKGKQQRMEKK